MQHSKSAAFCDIVLPGKNKNLTGQRSRIKSHLNENEEKLVKWLRPVKNLSKNNVGVLQKHNRNKNIGDGDLGVGG